MKIQCPAKINLDLKITSKREDGFHNLESVMQTISLYDYLTLETSPSEKFEINLSGTSDEIPYNEKILFIKQFCYLSKPQTCRRTKSRCLLKKIFLFQQGLRAEAQMPQEF